MVLSKKSTGRFAVACMVVFCAAFAYVLHVSGNDLVAAVVGYLVAVTLMTIGLMRLNRREQRNSWTASGFETRPWYPERDFTVFDEPLVPERVTNGAARKQDDRNLVGPS